MSSSINRILGASAMNRENKLTVNIPPRQADDFVRSIRRQLDQTLNRSPNGQPVQNRSDPADDGLYKLADGHELGCVDQGAAGEHLTGGNGFRCWAVAAFAH